MIAAISMMRPVNAFVAGLGVWVGSACLEQIPPGIPWGDALVLALLAAAGNVHNDLVDRDTDAINKPKAPLVSGAVHPLIAWAMVLTLSLTALVLALAHSPRHGAAAGGIALTLYLYNRFWKRQALVGNLAVALLCAAPLAWPMLDFGPSLRLLPLVGFAFIVTLAREIVKDLEDLPGDRAVGMRTLPVRVGPELASQLAKFCLGLALLLLPLPVMLGLWPPKFLWVALFLCLPPLGRALWMLSKSAPDWSRGQKSIKHAIWGGMGAAVFALSPLAHWLG